MLCKKRRKKRMSRKGAYLRQSGKSKNRDHDDDNDDDDDVITTCVKSCVDVTDDQKGLTNNA